MNGEIPYWAGEFGRQQLPQGCSLSCQPQRSRRGSYSPCNQGWCYLWCFRAGHLSPSPTHLPEGQSRRERCSSNILQLSFPIFPSATLKSNLRSGDKLHSSPCDGHFIRQTLWQTQFLVSKAEITVSLQSTIYSLCANMENCGTKNCFTSFFLPLGSNSNYNHSHSHISSPSPSKPTRQISCPGLD